MSNAGRIAMTINTLKGDNTMRKVVLNSKGLNKLAIINAESSIAFKDCVGMEINVTAAAVLEEDDGAVYSYLWSGEDCYAGNSASIRKAIEPIIELLDEGVKLTATPISRQSKNGKEFLSLRVKEV